MNNAVFGITMKNIRKHRDMKLVPTDKRRNQLFSEPNYHTARWFSENLLTIEMKETKVKMNKAVYLGMSISEISKTWMHEFWFDYFKPKYQNNAKLYYMDVLYVMCCMDTDSFIIKIKTQQFYKDIADDVVKWFDTSNYSENGRRPLSGGMKEKVTGLFKDEL